MPRRSTKKTRMDGMDQYALRKYLKKSSPRRKDDKDWTDVILNSLKRGRSNGEDET